MKLSIWSLVLVVALLSSTIVHAQTATSVNWDQSAYFQGDNGVLTVTLANSNGYQICTKQFYIQFDWQIPQKAVYASDATPCIATGQNYQFTIPLSVPSGTSIGQHSYNIVWVDQGLLLGNVAVNSGFLNVHDAYEKVYVNSAQTVQQSISQAQASNYKSPSAISDLNQAITYYNQAATLANQGQYQGAVTDLNQAQTLLSQAAAAEQSYQPPLLGGSNGNGKNGSCIGSVGLIAFVGALIFIKKEQC